MAEHYKEGSWHELFFYRDLIEADVAVFRDQVRAAFDAGDRPSGCEAYRHVRPNGEQTIVLSPNASALAYSLPDYKASLVAVAVPGIGTQSQPAFKKLPIFG